MTRHDCGRWRGYTDIFIGKHRKCLEPAEDPAYELLRRDRRASVDALWETAKVETTLRNARDAGKRWSASPSPRKSRRPRNNLFERRATRSEATACYRFTFAVIDRTVNYDPVATGMHLVGGAAVSMINPAARRRTEIFVCDRCGARKRLASAKRHWCADCQRDSPIEMRPSRQKALRLHRSADLKGTSL
jgi:hypothetical protein